ncbi:MAG: hypothetical protein KKF62_05220 [Bacteroidetes bacterium]|nr:hypothetical protein [Bacteroidota bacterium]MBU1116974.1 hypothetical protein [Bacteroidota bacterium]MBU1799041.1 hypothetical protein [Bacteroidota bacterium]
MTIQKKIAFIILLIGASAIIVFRGFQVYENSKEQYFSKEIEGLKITYNFILESNHTIAKQFFQNYVMQPEVLKILAEANSVDKKVKDKSRNELYNKLLPHYNNIKGLGVRQLHFHLPNSESFLRFNRINKWGDSLIGVRFSVEKANKELVEVVGFEEGETFNGFRNVFPIIYNGKHLGSVEVSMSYKSIVAFVEKILLNKTDFILKKTIVEKKGFFNEQSNYKLSTLSNEFFVTKASRKDSIIVKLNRQIFANVSHELNNGKEFIKNTSLEKENWQIVFIPVKNIENQNAAYFVSYKKDETINGFFFSFVVNLIISIVIIFVIILLFYQLSKKNLSLKNSLKDLKTAEEQLKSSLKEKDILLKEVHHRVKNNMQIVMSLLNLQANSIEDLVIRNAFAESNSRINAMGLIHETLYKSDNLSTIDPEEYINKLIQNTVRAFGSIDKKIKHELEIEKMDFSLDETIPIALIINELLTNAYKYAFPNKKNGKIKIIFKNLEDDKILLKFSDNGIGMPSEIKPYEVESLGMQLIFDLVEGQLKGDIDLDVTNGTSYTIVFAKKQ